MNGSGEELCVPKSVTDSQALHRILVAAGVAYECPTRSERSAQEVREISATIEALLAASGADAVPEFWDHIDNLHEFAFDIRSHRLKLIDWPRDEDSKQIVVSQKAKDCPLVANIQLKPFRGHAAPIGEVPARKRGSFFVDGSTNSAGEGRILAIRANGNPRLFCATDTLVTMPTTNAFHLIAIPQKAFHEEIRPELGTGFDSGFDQHLIELAASRAVSPGHVSLANISAC
jgi:hypothetical protein